MNQKNSAKGSASAASKKEKQKNLITTICVILAAILVIGLVVYNRLADTGFLLRAKTAAKSDHYTADGAMMAYWFGSTYQSYASMLSSYGYLDTSKSLKTQQNSLTGSGTWYDYFMDGAKTSAAQILGLCDAAYEAGMTLTDEEKASIDETISNLETSAKNAGYDANTYLALSMGNPIRVGDVRKCLELSTLAQKYSTEYANSLTYTDDQLAAYCEENPDTFNGIDYLYYTLSAEDFAEYDDDGNPLTDSDANSAKAKEAADTLAAATSADAFRTALKGILTDLSKSEDDITDALSGIERIHVTASNLSSDAADLFDLSAGSTLVTPEEDGATSYTVYLVTKTAYRDETKTRSVRHILLSSSTYEDSTTPDAVYAEWEASGFTLDKFLELSEQYNEDTGSASNGGLYANLAYGDTVADFNAWVYDASRQPGDHGMVETTYGWHILYFVGESDVTGWEATATSALKSSDSNALLTERSSHVTFIDSALNAING